MIVAKTSEMAENFERGETISLSLSYHNRTAIRFINSVVCKILARSNLTYLQDTILAILREIIINAVKANSKRLFFNINHLDIADREQYLQGMEGFKAFILEHQDFVEGELRKSDYRVIVTLKKHDEGFSIHVQNNTPIQPEEMERFKTRIEKACQYNDFSECYSDVLDDIEGEGLGLVLTVLFLRNTGIGVKALQFTTNTQATEASLTVPFQLKPLSVMNDIKQRILDEISDLPTLPENVIQLEKLCDNPESDIRHIVERISMDPGLSVAVLKLSNSAAFITRKKIETIHEAVSLIGMKNLRAIIIASGARRILEERYASFRQVWDHCTTAAYYARRLAEALKLGRLSQNAYLAAMLHDLGKIILLSTGQSLTEWLFMVAENRGMRSSTDIEEVSIGISHSNIGEQIARKWNLPEYLVQTIQWHHAPLNCAEEHRDLVYLTYLADKLCRIDEKKYDYCYLEEAVLDRFGLHDEKAFAAFHAGLRLDRQDAAAQRQ